MNVKLLTGQHLELLSLKGGCSGSSESTLVKMPHCWKSHVAAHFYLFIYLFILGFIRCFMRPEGRFDGKYKKIRYPNLGYMLTENDGF